ncbi:MAG TPA: DUF4124 domain-containing protein [Nevskiaceae bacterium]|nr:DUF4124 domain-containing protein [Nevskiaceae bacterium]
MIIRSIALAAMLFGATTASAGLHKCKDAKGNITYQDHVCGAGKTSAEFSKAADTGSRSIKTIGAERSRPVSRR